MIIVFLIGNALSCYKCQSLELHTPNVFVRNAFDSLLPKVRSEHCEQFDYDKLSKVDCPSVEGDTALTSDYKCGLLKGTAEATVQGILLIAK